MISPQLNRSSTKPPLEVQRKGVRACHAGILNGTETLPENRMSGKNRHCQALTTLTAAEKVVGPGTLMVLGNCQSVL